MPTRRELADALDRWQRAAGPYWMYVCATPFLRAVPPPPGQKRAPRSARDAVRALAALPPDERWAIFIDRPPVPVLGAAAELSRLGYRVVPVIQRFCVARAVVRSERLAEALVESSCAVAPLDEARGVVLLLDGDRLGPHGDDETHEPPSSLFDNRYEYPPDRFPPPELLIHEGVTTVGWIGGDLIAPDLQVYARQLAEAGLASAEWRGAGGKWRVGAPPAASYSSLATRS